MCGFPPASRSNFVQSITVMFLGQPDLKHRDPEHFRSGNTLTFRCRNSGRKTAAHFLELLTLLPQLRTENRCALFLELLTLLPQLRTENRCALFLELL
ncbi:hypothetical protein [Sinorhizobium meliloti]|uniref:hypothetical protein n=1 Tax=Rhizobium meliloti TaxID=382 RepID=UPI00186584E8|nr:hypothetical protein [Sinorhizobium meliloti]